MDLSIQKYFYVIDCCYAVTLEIIFSYYRSNNIFVFKYGEIKTYSECD